MHSLAHNHQPESGGEPVAGTRGLVMNWGRRYDLLVSVLDALTLGTLRGVRETAAGLARLQPGEAVLDVGCGTGTLALLAKERVGPTGRVVGIDPGPKQIARARAKASRRGLPIEFLVGVVERLDLPDHSFDAVLSTMMMHHLPDDLKRRGLGEIARILKPGGRLIVVDFRRARAKPGKPARLGAGQEGIQDLPRLMSETGFAAVKAGDVRFPRLPGVRGAGFALGKAVH